MESDRYITYRRVQELLNQQTQQDMNARRIQSLNNAVSSISSAAGSSLAATTLQNAINQLNNNSSGGEMPPRLFIDGQKVTVRRGKTVWTIIRSEVRQGPMGYAHMYYLEDERSGAQTREEERDLVAYTQATGTQSSKTEVNFDTVVIAPEKRQQIEEALEQVNSFDLIFDTWGFSETVEKGRGVSMLFYGPPGTGKTLMAQAIANKLGKTLNIISTADIESSAPGEAERNIRKHFKEAKEKGNILLFDECDSLIFTRSATGPILGAQINELLSQIERFDGVTLFTTNRLGTLDEAVNRRLALKLEIGMPTFEERAKIWERMFPKKAPLAKDIDFKKLAVVEITGGYIKNAVLRAARMAAIQKLPNNRKKITMEHLKRAVRQEAESMIEFENARAAEDGKRYVAKPGGEVAMQGGSIGIERSTDMKESVEAVAGQGAS